MADLRPQPSSDDYGDVCFEEIREKCYDFMGSSNVRPTWAQKPDNALLACPAQSSRSTQAPACYQTFT